MAASVLDPYEVLGVRRGATRDQIRAAYREQVARYHPDKHRGNPLEELAAQKLVEINQAYATLSDDGQRAGHETGPPGAAQRAASAAPVASSPTQGAKLLRSAGMIVSLIFFLKFGLGLASGLLLLVRSLIVGLLSLLRMGPIFAIVIVAAIAIGTSSLLRARKR